MKSVSSYSIFYSKLYLFVFMVFLFVHIHEVSAYKTYSSISSDSSSDETDISSSSNSVNSNDLHKPDNEEIIIQPWFKIFHNYHNRLIYAPKYDLPSNSDLNLRNNRISHVSNPSRRRAIPIELQKALFAHGIVGRRR